MIRRPIYAEIFARLVRGGAISFCCQISWYQSEVWKVLLQSWLLSVSSLLVSLARFLVAKLAKASQTCVLAILPNMERKVWRENYNLSHMSHKTQTWFQVKVFKWEIMWRSKLTRIFRKFGPILSQTIFWLTGIKSRLETKKMSQKDQGMRAIPLFWPLEPKLLKIRFHLTWYNFSS